MRRKLLILAAALTVAEFASLAMLLRTFLPGVISSLVAAALALAPNLLTLLGPWTVLPNRLARGLSVDAPPETAREEMVQLPRRVLFARTIGTTLLTFVLAPIAVSQLRLPPEAAGILAGLTVGIAFAFNNVRTYAYRWIIDSMTERLYASDHLRYQARTIRERLFVSANILGIAGTIASAVFTYFILETSRDEFAETSVVLPALIGALATAFGIDVYRSCTSLVAWAARTPNADARRAFTSSASLPYRLAASNLLCWTIAAGALAASHWRHGALAAAIAQVFAGIVSVGCGTVMYQAVWHQRILAPLREAAADELVERGIAIPRGRLTIGGQLLIVFLLLLGAGGAFAFATIDAERQHPHSLGPASVVYVLAVLLLAAFGVVWLFTRELVGPIRTLERHARRLGRGELDEPIPPGSADEIGSLANTLEASRRSLKQTLSEVRELNASLEGRVQARTFELEQTNRELARALQALASAQDAMVGAEKLASLGRMSAGIAHEVNNPLNFVKNALGPLQRSIGEVRDAVRRGAPSEAAGTLEEMDDVVRVMTNGVERMAQILRALLDFSRQAPDAKPERFDLRRAIDSALALVQHELRNRVTVTVDLGGVDALVAEPGPIGQVLMNLVKNAAEAIDGPGTIEVRARRIDDRVELSVKDSGRGMPPDVVQRAFEPFFTTKAVGGGTGLGLAMVHGIVQKHGGTTRISSTPGEGTTVTLGLPQRPADDPTAPSEPPRSPEH